MRGKIGLVALTAVLFVAAFLPGVFALQSVAEEGAVVGVRGQDSGGGAGAAMGMLTAPCMSMCQSCIRIPCTLSQMCCSCCCSPCLSCCQWGVGLCLNLCLGLINTVLAGIADCFQSFGDMFLYLKACCSDWDFVGLLLSLTGIWFEAICEPCIKCLECIPCVNYVVSCPRACLQTIALCCDRFCAPFCVA